MTDIQPAWSEPFFAGVGPAPHLELPSAPSRAWAYGDGRGRGVRVAVVDSGVEQGHPAVGTVVDFVAVKRDEDEPDGVAFERGEHPDVYGHGTACAGIIRSIAPEVELVSVQVLGANMRANTLAFAHAVNWCVEQRIDIVNLSLSTSNDDYAETFWDLVDEAHHHRVMLVSAMNNERKRTIPSEFSGVFSVACAPGTDRESVWCNPHGPAEWGAAGVDVEVAWSGGGSIVASGNSFAAPVVSGHLARIVGAHPGITPWQARTVLAAVAANATFERSPGSPA
jgi:subtilisin family serine protease